VELSSCQTPDDGVNSRSFARNIMALVVALCSLPFFLTKVFGGFVLKLA
jgi:hypothetical protein